MSETTIKLLIVDDHTLFRDGLRAIFQNVHDIDVVGEAATGVEAIQLATTLEPDVILMDIQMDDMNGIDATRRILGSAPNIRVIMLTMLEDSESLFAAMTAGARSYILKGADKAAVLKTLRSVADGEVLFGSAIADRVTSYFQNLSTLANTRQSDDPSFAELTEREREILHHIARGLNNHEIAGRLHIAVKTVSNHISNIFNKLQVVDRAQAIIKAREAGLGKDDKQ